VGAVLVPAEAPTPVVQGKAELRAAWESQVEAVDLRGEPEEFIPVGDDKVVVPVRMVALGSGSELSLTASLTWVYTFGDDCLCMSVEAFDRREDAFKSAGHEE
jgi:hypothetical protein